MIWNQEFLIVVKSAITQNPMAPFMLIELPDKTGKYVGVNDLRSIYA
jgi:hypothetical protein